MKYPVKMPRADSSCRLIFFSYEAGVSISKDGCISRYQKRAKCQAATYIIAETCTCKYDSNCRYPNSKAIECILDNIGEVQDNSAAYLMRNSASRRTS